MAVLDTLEILIEADRSGLETQLKSAGRNISDFVSQMNKQEVNWTQILSRTISPAIISSTAALFATAISQMVSFQNQTKNLNNVASGAFADGMSNIDVSVYQMQQNTHASLLDTAAAFSAFKKANLDDATAQYATTEAAGLARAAKMELGDVVKMLVPLFDEWGVKTIPQVNAAMTGLANAAGQGKFSLNELVNVIERSAELKKVTTISDMAIDIQALSNVASKSTVAEMIQSMASQANSAVSPLSIFASEGLGKLSTLIQDKGLIEAFVSVRRQIKNFGDDAKIAGDALGLSEAEVSKFSTTSVESLKNVAKQADYTKTHLKSFEDIVKENTTSTDELKMAWNDFITQISKFTVPGGISLLKNALEGLTHPIDTLKEGIPAVIDQLSEMGKANVVGSTLMSAGTGAALGLMTAGPVGGVVGGLAGGLAGLGAGLQANMGDKTQQETQPQGRGATTFNNTYNITSPAGAEKMTGDSISHSLYNQFQGIH